MIWKEIFQNYSKDFRSFWKFRDDDCDTLWYEYQQFSDWIIKTISNVRKCGLGYEIKLFFK